jgi:hypothetical protein
MEFWLLYAGIAMTVTGVIFTSWLLVQVGTLVLALAGLTFAVAVCRIYCHLVPRLTPLPEAQIVGT